MTDTIEKKKQFSAQLALALEPLAEILIGYGVSKIEFEQIAGDAYKRVNTDEELKKPGEPVANVVARDSLHAISNIGDEPGKGYSITVDGTFGAMEFGQLLHFWHTDSEFVEEDGRPKSLPFSKGRPSFVDLVEKHAGKSSPGQVLATMIQVGVIDLDSYDKFFPTKYSFIPKPNRLILGLNLRNYLSTYAHNLRADAKEEESRVHRNVFARVPNDHLEDVRRDFRERVLNFVEHTDRDLTKLEKIGAELSVAETTLIGISAFVFEE